MSSRLKAIAAETVAIVESGRYRTTSGTDVVVGPEVAAAVAGTRLYLPDDDLPPGPSTATAPAVVTVSNESSLAAARRLGGDVACLVFASARNPGGGFLNGAEAQEESIARASALYTCQRAVPDFYRFHRHRPELTYSDRVIYSPAVSVFRDRRARRVLDVAAAHGHRRLVVGAWGCGVFGNDPNTVADAFAAALDRSPAFDRVVFAVLDTRPTTPTYSAFADRFGRPENSATTG